MDKTQVIDKLFNLYIIQTGKYLIQNKDGKYRFITAGNREGKKVNKLCKPLFEQHLKYNLTIGTMSSVAYTKFITFDIDFPDHDDNFRKWIVYKLIDTLENMGIFFYYVNFSGSKGYHVDILIDDLLTNQMAKQFFNLVINKSDIVQYMNEGNKVEFRPMEKQGVKLPLGIHQVTKKYCGFCDIENGLNVMLPEESQEYLFTIEKLKRQTIIDILQEHSKQDTILDLGKEFKKKEIVRTEDAISRHKDLPIYNPSTDDCISEAEDLYYNGLKYKGSRHESIKKICKWLKYNGINENEAIDMLYEWMENQDARNYSTSLKDCYEDIDSVTKWVYEKSAGIIPKRNKVEVTLNEIHAIIKQCPEKNQKLIAYAMLVHSKMFSSKGGIFYATFPQMAEATGLCEKTIRNQVKKMEELGILEVVDRNRKIEGTFKKAPNKYKVILADECGVEMNNVAYMTDRKNNLSECMVNLIDLKELKKLIPRRQFEGLRLVG